MRLKWLLKSIIVLFLCTMAILALAHKDSTAAASSGGSEKIESNLLEQITADGSADFIIRFTEQADLSAAYSMDWEARGEFVYNTLRESAERSQVNAKIVLDNAGFKYQTFIAGNELYVWGNKPAEPNSMTAFTELATINELAGMAEVSTIRATRTYSIEPVSEAVPLDNIYWAGDLLANHVLVTVQSATAAALDWGITDTKADKFWTRFRIQGDGIVVANIDTGVQWNHPALIRAYKCTANVSDPSCWFEPVDQGSTTICDGSPCDNNGHGTHTMGTMVGDNDPSLLYNVGMAPDAKWIACKGCQTKDCSDFALNACADWILAPGGSPSNRPNIVNNSWGGDGGNPWFLEKVQAWRASGIFPAFSAGNSTGCPVPTVTGSMGSPGDYQESFASTGHNIYRQHYFAQGPSAFGDTPYTKPNLSAPAVYIWSTIPTNSWRLDSGTSMASPHSAGAVALLWSCNRSLIGQIDATFEVLQKNADSAPGGTCGAPSDGEGNYTFGYGYLDVLTAGNVTCSMGTLTGYVLTKGALPIGGVTITAKSVNNGNQIQTLTDPTGHYTMSLLVDRYRVTASKIGYFMQTNADVVITKDGTTISNFSLDPAKTIFLPMIAQSTPMESPIP